MTRRWFASLLAAQFAAVSSVAAPPPAVHPVVGNWHVYSFHPDTECAETWEIRADGTTHNVSGAEESFSEYDVSPSLTPAGYYVFVDTITRTNGQPDCAGSVTPVGDRSTGYLLPLSADRFAMCLGEALSHCVAAMIRASADRAIASDASATVTTTDPGDTCAIELPGRAAQKADVPCSEVAVTLFQLGVPAGSAVVLRAFGIAKERSAALHKQIEDAGYQIRTIKVGFLTEPSHADR